MTTKSWTMIGMCALASLGAGVATVWRRRASDVRTQAGREMDRCERILRSLDARAAGFR